jgi:hypothetical protein
MGLRNVWFEWERFLELLGFNRGTIARKNRSISSIAKSQILCFKVLLEFVPTVFVIAHESSSLAAGINFGLWGILLVLPVARTGVALEGSLLGSNTHTWGAKSIRFEFVLASFFNCLPVCSIRYWLRSLFFVFLNHSFFPDRRG